MRQRERKRRGGERAILCFVFGFACACPLLLVGGINMRLTDVACGVAALAASCDVWRRQRFHPAGARLAPFLVVSLVWVAAEICYSSLLVSESPSRMVLVRWLMALPAGYVLCVASESGALRTGLLWGLVAGLFADTAFLTYDFATFEVTGQPAFMPDDSRVTWVGSDYRALGIFDHPNAAAIASLALVALLIGLAEESGRGGMLAALGWVVTIGVFYMTRSRGEATAAFALLALWSFARMKRAARLFAIFGACVLVAMFLCWPVAYEGTLGQPDIADMIARFTNADAIRENSAGRSSTVMASLQLALQHPLGMGSTYGPVLNEMTGEFEATHNGILQLALLGGIPVALFVLARLARGAARVWRVGARVEHWLALYLLMVAMFEEMFFIPTVSILVLWLGTVFGRPMFRTRPAPARLATR